MHCRRSPTAIPWWSTASRPRDNQLQRLSGRGGSKAETIAANVTHLIVVMAALPAPDLYLTDRYLCAARLMGATSAIAWNKADVARHRPPQNSRVYETLGCPVFPCRRPPAPALTRCCAWIGTGTGILVGPVGRRQVVAAERLVPGADVADRRDLAVSDEGRHTTTASILYPLPAVVACRHAGGPRFRAGHSGADGDQRTVSSRSGARPHCRFADCSHLREPTVRCSAAVPRGPIDARRYESYRRLMNLAGAVGRARLTYRSVAP